MRRRSFAQSVVVTVSLAELAVGGCDGAKEQPKVAETKKVEEEVHYAPNPPPPKKKKLEIPRKVPGTGKDGPPPKPEGSPEEPDPFAVPKNKIPIGDSIFILEPAGRCTESRNVKCKPGKHCNPPPLVTVDCPKELELPKSKKPDALYQRSDSTCWERGKTNKTPSTRVVCPDKLQPPKLVPKPDDDDHSDDDE